MLELEGLQLFVRSTLESTHKDTGVQRDMEMQLLAVPSRVRLQHRSGLGIPVPEVWLCDCMCFVCVCVCVCVCERERERETLEIPAPLAHCFSVCRIILGGLCWLVGLPGGSINKVWFQEKLWHHLCTCERCRFWSLPDLLNRDLHFSKIPRWCTVHNKI
jgi:hypothetical protein